MVAIVTPFRDEAIGNLESGRNEVLKWVSQTPRLREYDVSIVFDAHHTEASHPTLTSHGFIRIIFSQGGQTADDLIREMACQSGPAAIVVTSDKEVARYAERKGCGVLGSREFQMVMDRPDEIHTDQAHKLPKGKRRALMKLLRFPESKE